MGSFVLRVEGDSLQMVSFRVKVWVACFVFLSYGIFRSQSRGRLYRWSVLGLRFGLLVLSFYLMGPFVLKVEGDSLQMVSFRVKIWVTCIVFLSNGIFRSQSRGRLYRWSVLGLRFGLLVLSFYLMGPFVLKVEGDSLQMVSFRVKIWVTCIVFLSNGIFRSQSRGRLSTDGQL